jgi:16S rRNA (guanine(527)-N(7))-methyltransferase RsmG
VTFREFLVAEWGPYGALSEAQLSALEKHYQLLKAWNRRMNLTRIDDLEDAVRLHYCESLYLGRSLPPGKLSIADIGSGAGFPGIPVAILRPECSISLIDSHARKAVFLREAAAKLANVTVVQDRAESVPSRYDWSISRAVAAPAVLALGLSSKVAILTTEIELENLERRPIIKVPVPWGDQRVVAMFHVEH